MHLNKVLEAVNSLNDYASASQNVDWEVVKMEKLQLNMSIVLAMKKVKTFEIEYFNKFGENGCACIVMTHILKQPSSKIWAVLGIELVNLLKYWLESLRKHLVNHNPVWWSFMEIIIKFIKEIRQKHSSIPNILVEQTAECLLDLSTNEKSDECKKLEILQCLNIYCAESSREIRFAMRNKFSNYFVKLSAYMSTCGHLPCQFIIIETLLRWLVPRHNPDVRSSSAKKWFPRALYSQKVVDIFLERPWTSFVKDARDFLNTHNEVNESVLSLICKKVCIGDIEITYDTEDMETWLDINSKGSCMSIFVDPKMLVKFSVQNQKTFVVLIIKAENTSIVQLYRESRLMTISVTMLSTPSVYPSSTKIAIEGVRHLQFSVSSSRNLIDVDKALRKVYGDKFKLMTDLKREHTLSPQQTSHSDLRISRPAWELKFSQPVGNQRGRRSGYVFKSKNPAAYNSPSTTSTTSLAHLHERLAALPRYPYDKKSLRVCESPNLTKVTEASETDERQTLNSANDLKLTTNKCHGVSHISINKKSIDNSQKNVEVKKKNISLDNNDDRSTSCLLIATIGSTDDSVISNTIERFSKTKEYKPNNIVDLLIKEALQNDTGDRDKNINSKKKTQKTDNINKEIVKTEFTELEITRGKQNKKNCIVINRSSSTDDSNANIINETPVNCVTFRTKNTCRRRNVTKPVRNRFNNNVLNKDKYDKEIVIKSFKQKLMENSGSNIVISPTLTKKFNETNPETNESVGNIINELSSQKVYFMVEDIEISECLNSIVDKVCNENVITNHDETRTHFEVPSHNEKNKVSAVNLEQNKQKSKYSLHLKFPVAVKNENTIKTRSNTKKNDQKEKDGNNTMLIENDITIINDESKKVPKRNTKVTYNRKKKNSAKFVDHKNNQANSIRTKDGTEKENITQIHDSSVLIERLPQEKETENNKTPAFRRKRKLYSPIMEQSNNDLSNKQTSDFDENMLMSSNKSKPKMVNSNATFYKDIEKERRNYTRRPRNLRSKSKTEEIQSPRTHKINQAFDKLKETVETNHNLILVDVNSANYDVFNFTSDSEDDDFKSKKTYVQKRISASSSIEPNLSSTRGTTTRRGNYTKKYSNTKKSYTKTTKSNKVSKVAKKRSNKRKISIPTIDLDDERIRQSNTDVLNTSLVIEKPKNLANDRPVPVLRETPHLEDYSIHDKEIEYTNTKNNETKLTVKNNKNDHRSLSDDRTTSPLPELVVEMTIMTKDDIHSLDSVIRSDTLKSLKKMYSTSANVYLNETNKTEHQLLGGENNNQNEQFFNNEIQTIRNFINISSHESLKISNNDTKPTKTDKKNNYLKNIEGSDHNEQEIIEITDFIPEKSISTVGITAHGDFDESPPNMKNIEQKVSPRNLEIEDLDKSSKDYYNRLESELNQTKENSHSLKRNTSIQHSISSASNANKNPCVSLTRLSLSELNQTKENSHSLKRNTSIQHSISSASSANKNPCVSLTRLSFDDIKNVVNLNESLSKLSVKSGKTVQQSKKSKSKISNKETPLLISPESKSTASDRCLLVSGKTKIKENVENSTVSHKSFKIKYNTRKWLPSSRNSESDFENNIRNVQSVSNSSRQSKSDKDECIQEERATAEKKSSPRAEVIHSRQKLISNTLDISPHTSINTTNSDKVQELYINRRITRQSKLTESEENTKIIKKSAITRINKEIFLKNLSRSSQIIKEDIKPVTDLSQNLNTYRSEHTSTHSATRRELDTNRNILRVKSNLDSSKISREVRRSKLKRTATIVEDLNKKKKYATLSASDDSIINVNAWFEKNDTASDKGDDATRLTMIDTLLDISEKLVITHTRMKTNTNKSLIEMVINIQKLTEKLHEDRRTMYIEETNKLVEKIRKLVDVMLADLEHKSQAMNVDFIKEIKENASKILLEDSRHRDSAMQMLMEEIEIAINQLKKKRNA